jgi:protocatechuate 3,4-dioxygenase beta subunit
MSNGVYIERDRSIHPPAYAPAYKTSIARSPRLPLLALQQSLSELTGPIFGHDDLDPLDNDLLRNARVDGDPIGERIIVHGRVLDETGRPVRGALLEFWQANAGGRYRHVNDNYVAALDRNFSGCGRYVTDDDDAYHFRYRFDIVLRGRKQTYFENRPEGL